MNNHPYKVAVYGTLRKGEGNHYILQGSENTKFLGEDYVPATMYSLGGFPCIRLHGDIHCRVLIEVYEVDKHTLARMDRLEGVDHGMYSRESISTKYGKTYIYQWVGPVHRFPVIECGDWKKRNDT